MKPEMELAIKQVAPEVADAIWNAAIEAAAKEAQRLCDDDSADYIIVECIRKLKK